MPAARDAPSGRVEERAEPAARSPGRRAGPRTDALTPSTRASAATAKSTCRRVAPMERRSANSRTALGDGDREGVEDDEGADEQGRAGEGQQRRREEAPDAVVGLLGVVGGGLLPVLISRLRGSAWRRRATSSVGVTPGAAEATTRETLPSRPYQRLDVGHRGDDERRAADRGHVAVIGDADQPHVLDAGPRRHADALADREVLVLGQLAIDQHLAALPGQPPGDVAQRIEGLAHRGDDDRRRELRLDRLAPDTSEPVWKSSPWTSAAPGTRDARTTVRWSIRSLAPKVLVKALRGDIWASTPELAVRVMSFIAVRI